MKEFFPKLLSKAKGGLLSIIKKPITWVILALLVAIAIIGIQSSILQKRKAEISRLEMNQEALLTDVQYYQAENGQLVATVNAITLRRDELENLLPSYTQEIANLKLKLKNVETVAKVSVRQEAEIQAPIVPMPPPPVTITLPAEPKEIEPEAPVFEPETPHEFSYNDEWISVSGILYQDSLANIRVEHRDSLILLAHKTKRRCCRKSKIIKYDVQAKSPYTTITDVEYVELIE